MTNNPLDAWCKLIINYHWLRLIIQPSTTPLMIRVGILKASPVAIRSRVYSQTRVLEDVFMGGSTKLQLTQLLTLPPSGRLAVRLTGWSESELGHWSHLWYDMKSHGGHKAADRKNL